ncbi:MAG: transporter substrate-binding domain-containing protein [Caldilineaceae bacterium]
MKHLKNPSLFIILFILAATVLTACGGSAAATPAPPTPPAVPASAWARIQQSGKLVVGTSADYPPFESYNANFRLEGFDPALVVEIAQVMGVQPEFKDIAFDGLTAALDLEQIDIAVAAISTNPERAQAVDFSQIYYVSEDAILAGAGANIPKINSVAELAAYTIGVQKGSVYEQWLKDNLVSPGQIPATNLFVYDDIDHAIRDLRGGRVNVVVLDLLPAEEFVAQGDLTLVGQGLNRQRYAIAMAKGESELQSAINDALFQLQSTGVVANLAEEYLAINAQDILPTPAATAAPATVAPTATTAAATAPPPTATSAPVACLDGMEYLADLSFDDHNMTAPPVLRPGEPFRKGWRIRNIGACTWNGSYAATYVQGNAPAAVMGGQPSQIQGNVAPGATYDLYLNLVAPLAPGTFQGTWQLRNAQGVAFGQRLWVGIVVPSAAAPTPVPTQTPSPNFTFTVDNPNIRTGDCTTMRWRVTNVNAVYFYAEGQSWEQNGVGGEENRQICPNQTTNYYLRVVRANGAVETRQLTVNVQSSGSAPQINRFTMDPSGQIAVGQCINLRWEVTGDIRRVKLIRNNDTFWNDAPFQGNNQDCPPGAGSYTYSIEANGPGGTNRASLNLQVVNAAATPTSAPPAEALPVINAFTANPGQIMAGQCVNLAWSTSGGTENVRVLRNGVVVLDNAPLSSTGLQDCLDQPGTITYVLEARNRVNQSASQQASVNVAAAPAPTDTPAPTNTPLPVAPVIISFNVDRSQITFSECVVLSWEFTGDSLAQVQLLRNGDAIAGDMPSPGSFQDCPPAPGQITYQLVVDSEFGGSARQAVMVDVQDASDGEGAVEQLPEIPPSISSFTVDTTQIDVGGCVVLSWEFGGSSLAAVRLTRNDVEIASDMASPGSFQDCINDDSFVGTVVYRLVVDSEFSGSDAAEQFVTVVGG